MTAHNFQKSLEDAKRNEEEPWWTDLYDRYFPDHSFIGMIDITDLGQQLAGIDRELILRDSGKVILIDEKVRGASYDDILLEYWSAEETKAPGWIQKNLLCDYIAYVFKPPVKRCYLLPFDLLRRAWFLHGREWISKYRPPIRVENEGYTTVSVAVPIDAVMKALVEAMRTDW
jgi:hypothetical protein